MSTSRRRLSEFASKASSEFKRRLSVTSQDEEGVPRAGWASLIPMYAGLSAQPLSDGSGVEVGLSIHDGSYPVDFSVQILYFANNPDHSVSELLEEHIVQQLIEFSEDHLFKFIGTGVTEQLTELAPGLCTRLWKELDMVPIVFKIRSTMGREGQAADPAHSQPRPADEQADSAARKCVMYFGPSHIPRLSIGFRNVVEVDAAGKIHLIDGLEEYKNSVRAPTWNVLTKYAKALSDKGTKIAFFSSTPQGGGVALMRHAMIRLLRNLGVDAAWYVPKPSPAVFRTTKNNHNILQGVAEPSLRLTLDRQEEFTKWITYNAKRYWLSEGGPLAKGGIDVCFIDDPQMPGLIPLIRAARPELPIVYRSHIEVRSDLIHKEGSPQAEVWKYLWDRIQLCDVFISHPVNKFVPDSVPIEKVGLMGAATDWLDGLSKPLREWDLEYYMRLFRTQCNEVNMNPLAWPSRPYIVQIARFDPAKGIPVVIESYCKLRKKLERANIPASRIPQLLLCGHGAIDDPDASIIYDDTMMKLQQRPFAQYAHDIVVMRIGPSDQMLNALLTNARCCLQLSSREGFEVKVSEAIHHGKPIVATRAGGIPLQVQHGKNGFLVDVGDSDAVARHLYDLWVDDDLFKRVSEYAKVSVSDEVSTQGNLASWLYMATKLAAGETLKPNGRFINDLMREEAGEPYLDDEPRIPRGGIEVQAK